MPRNDVLKLRDCVSVKLPLPQHSRVSPTALAFRIKPPASAGGSRASALLETSRAYRCFRSAEGYRRAAGAASPSLPHPNAPSNPKNPTPSKHRARQIFYPRNHRAPSTSRPQPIQDAFMLSPGEIIFFKHFWRTYSPNSLQLIQKVNILQRRAKPLTHCE